jgi:hypothetical protein
LTAKPGTCTSSKRGLVQHRGQQRGHPADLDRAGIVLNAAAEQRLPLCRSIALAQWNSFATSIPIATPISLLSSPSTERSLFPLSSP